MTCTVSGNLIDLQEQPRAKVAIKFAPEKTGLYSSGGDTVLPDTLSAQSDVNGAFSIALLPGVYMVTARNASVQIVVPDAALANLGDIMNLTPPPDLTDAEQAEQNAQISASKAYLAANAPRDQELEGGGFSGRHFKEVTEELAGTVAGQADTVNTQHGEILAARDAINQDATQISQDKDAIAAADQSIADSVAANQQAASDMQAAAQSVGEDRAAIETLEQTIAGHAQTATDKAQEATDARDAILSPLLQSATALATTHTLILQLHAAQTGA